MATENANGLPRLQTQSVIMEAAYLQNHPMTVETAQQQGYPNVRVYVMDRLLAELAREWRYTRSIVTLTEYHLIYYKAIVFGMPPDRFSQDTILPSEYMPELPPLSSQQEK